MRRTALVAPTPFGRPCDALWLSYVPHGSKACKLRRISPVPGQRANACLPDPSRVGTMTRALVFPAGQCVTGDYSQP